MGSVAASLGAKIGGKVLTAVGTKVAGTALSGLLKSKQKSVSQKPEMSYFNVRMPSGQVVAMAMPTGGQITEGPKTTTGDILGDALQGGTDAFVTNLLAKKAKSNLTAKAKSSEWGDSGSEMDPTSRKLMNYQQA